MAWSCSGNSNEELIQNLFENEIIHNQRVIDAMKSVDRGNYVVNEPYKDSPQPIGYAATISAPHMVILHETLQFSTK
jgi:protein-L-isoaspartate(D-aspartate) O-methyltransferase